MKRSFTGFLSIGVIGDRLSVIKRIKKCMQKVSEI